MNKVIRFILLASLFVVTTVSNASSNTEGARETRFPRIVLYTAAGCKSCNAASEFLSRNNIAFIKKDVSANNAYMEEMTSKYRVNAVPLIVIGNDQKVLRGFVQEAFQSAVREVMAKRR